MILSLPNDGQRIFVFVHAVRDIGWMRRVIGDIRGGEMVERVKFLCAADVHEALRLMRGLPVDRIFIDHSAGAALHALEWRKEFAAA